ncbi:MAG: hypothetical protein KDJ19_00640 [Hyphomicrobiaceae bacterium]|nr:hypothetical protein [Hyphomicrobiaceae bacterium]
MTVFLTLIAAVFAIGVPLLLARFFHAKTRRMRIFEQASEEFVSSADALLDDSDTPFAVIAIVAMMNRLIGDPRAAGALLRVVFGMQFGKYQSEDDTLSPEDEREVDAFFKARPELHEAFRRLVSSYFIASVYRGEGFSGTLARLILHNAASILSTAAMVKSAITSSRRNGDGNHSSPLGPIHKPA